MTTNLGLKFLGQVFSEFVQELECGEVVRRLNSGHSLDADGQVLSHEPGLDGLHTGVLKGLAKMSLKTVIYIFCS